MTTLHDYLEALKKIDALNKPIRIQEKIESITALSTEVKFYEAKPVDSDELQDAPVVEEVGLQDIKNLQNDGWVIKSINLTLEKSESDA